MSAREPVAPGARRKGPGFARLLADGWHAIAPGGEDLGTFPYRYRAERALNVWARRPTITTEVHYPGGES